MRAVVITEHGGPEVLQVQERPDPPVGPGEVRIAVKAAGVNFADTMARPRPYPHAPHPPRARRWGRAGAGPGGEAAAAAGTALRQRLRPFDLIAHRGEGRFAVLMPEAGEDEARAWAEEATTGWKLSLVWPETEQRIGIDIGFTVDPLAPGDHDPLALLERRLESFARRW